MKEMSRLGIQIETQSTSTVPRPVVGKHSDRDRSRGVWAATFRSGYWKYLAAMLKSEGGRSWPGLGEVGGESSGSQC